MYACAQGVEYTGRKFGEFTEQPCNKEQSKVGELKFGEIHRLTKLKSR